MPSTALYGVSEPFDGFGGAEVLSADVLAVDGGDLVAPAIMSKLPPARPVSPGTIEKTASLLRSLSFAAARPATKTESPAERGRAYAAVGHALRSELQSDQMVRLRSAAPELGPRVQAALLAACGALLSSQDADQGYEWASAELDDLAKHVPPSSSAVFPGAYYHEIFSSDIAELARSLAQRRREEAQRRAVGADVLAVLARGGVGVAEVVGVGRAADDVGLAAEGAACRTISELIEREERARQSYEAAAAEAREAKRMCKEHEANAAREARALADERARRQQASEELSSVKAALAREEELRRKVEAAQVRTLEEMRAHEEARWEAVERLQNETVRSMELEAAKTRAEEEMVNRVESAEARVEKANAESSKNTKLYVEAEKMRTALQGRVTALDDVKSQLEQQLAIERQACAVELGLRQTAEVSFADAQKAAADAQQASADATQTAEVAKGALEQATKELAAVEERLRVANDGSLDQQMISASAEAAVSQLKSLRGDDAGKMQRLVAEKATLEQKVGETEMRLQQTVENAESAEAAASRQRYDLQEQLTKLHRHAEDLQAKATRAELLLQHERETGLNASEHEKRLAEQLDEEKRARMALAQQLTAEAALRQRSDVSENARARDLQARDRDVELGAQRLQSMQAELSRAREEARQAREALADARAIAKKVERERDAEREDTRRERLRKSERDAHALTHPSGAAGGGPPHKPPRPPASLVASAGPSLQRELHMPPSASIVPPPPAQHPLVQSVVNDELSRSDLWNFSSGALGRGGNGTGPSIGRPGGPGGGGGGGAPPPPVSEGVNLPRIRSPYNVQSASGVGGLAATSLSADEARQLYGATAVPGLGGDDDL